MARYLPVALTLALVAPGLAQDTSKSSDHRAKAEWSDAERSRIHGLIEQLGSSDFDERKQAASELEKHGSKVAPLLEDVIERSRDPELRWQARQVLRRLQGGEKAEAGAGLRKDDGPRRRRVRAPGGGTFELDFGNDVFERMREQLDRALEGLPTGRMFGPDDFGFDFGPVQDAQRKSTSQSVKIQVTPDGVRVETEDSRDGKKDRKVYEAPDMETLLKEHPELKGRVSGWSSRRDGRKDAGAKVRSDVEAHLRKMRERLRDMHRDFDIDFDWKGSTDFGKKIRERVKNDLEEHLKHLRGLKGRFGEFDLDFDFDHDAGKNFRIRIETPDGVKEFGPKSGKPRVRVEGPAGKKLQRVEKKDAGKAPADDGPRLGIYVRGDLPETVREFLGLEDGVGLWVHEAVGGSLAAKAGLRSGDVVTKIGGRSVGSPEDVQGALRGASKRVKIEWIRRGERMSETVER